MLTDYLPGLALAALQTAPVAYAAWRLARRLVPASTPLLRLAAAFMCGILEALLAMQVLGLAGVFSRLPLVLAAWAVAGLTVLLERRVPARSGGDLGAGAPGPTALDAPRGAQQSKRSAEASGSRPRDWYRILVVTLVVGAGATMLYSGIAKAPFDADSVNYHLPAVANWLRSHSLLQIDQIQPGVYQMSYAMNSELLNAWFAMPFGRDFLANIGTLVAGAMMLLAVAALAERLGVRTLEAVVVGFAALFTAALGIGLGATSSDILPVAGTALAVACVLCWLDDVDVRRYLVLAGLALGLALGSKYSALFYVGTMGLAILVAGLRRRRRLDVLVILPLCVAAPAAAWYLRNWIVVGNPLWGFTVAVGGKVIFAGGWTRTTDDLSILGLIREEPATAFVRVVPLYAAALLSLSVALVAGIPGVVRSVRGNAMRIWMLVAVPVLAVLAVWASPYTASGKDHQFAGATIRYVAASFVLLFVAAGAGGRGGRRKALWRWGLLAGAMLNAAVVTVGPLPFLSLYRPTRLALAVGVGVAGVTLVWLLGVGAAVERIVPDRRVWIGVLAVVMVAASVVAARQRDRNWYRTTYNEGFDQLFRAVQDTPIRDARIAVAGMSRIYPLYGPDATNRVFFVGREKDTRPWTAGRQASWSRAIRSECADYVVVWDDPDDWFAPVPELRFVTEDPGMVKVFDREVEHVTNYNGVTRKYQRRIGLYRVTGLPKRCGRR